MSDFARPERQRERGDPGVVSFQFMTKVRLAAALANHISGGSVVIADCEGRTISTGSGHAQFGNEFLSDVVSNRVSHMPTVEQLRLAVGRALASKNQEPIADLLGIDDTFTDAWFVPISPLLVDLGRGVVRIRRDGLSSWVFATLLTPEEARDFFRRVVEVADSNRSLPEGYSSQGRFAPQFFADELLEATVCVFDMPADAPAGVAPMWGELVRTLQIESSRIAHFDDELDEFLLDF